MIREESFSSKVERSVFISTNLAETSQDHVEQIVATMVWTLISAVTSIILQVDAFVGATCNIEVIILLVLDYDDVRMVPSMV